jgi:hypothetical protein
MRNVDWIFLTEEYGTLGAPFVSGDELVLYVELMEFVDLAEELFDSQEFHAGKAAVMYEI